MRPSLILFLKLVILACSSSLVLAACKGPRRIRKEIRDLTVEEARDFIKGMRIIYTNGISKSMVDMHIRAVENAHNSPQFLPYHRLMTWNLENELLKVAPALKGLPYWDVTYDVDEPLAAFPFRDDMMGSATPGGKGCLEGPFSSVQFDGRCVTRALSGKKIWLSPELLAQQVMYFKDYILFNNQLRTTQHNLVHNFFEGSNFGTIEISPSDPLFWLHHGAIDYYWSKWQGLEGNANYNKYGGQYHKGPLMGQFVTVDDTIEGHKVSSLIDYYSSLCYQYEVPKNAVLNRVPFKMGAMSSAPPSGLPDLPPNNPANNPTTPTNPDAGRAIRMPTDLTEEFKKRWDLNDTQVKESQDLLKRFVGLLNDKKANGMKLMTLADLTATNQSQSASEERENSNAEPAINQLPKLTISTMLVLVTMNVAFTLLF